jgi:hypothetical protein
MQYYGSCQEDAMTGKKEMKDEILTFKVTAEEAEMIRNAAAREGVTVSQHIRTAILYGSFLEGDPVAVRIFKEGVVKATKEFVNRVTALPRRAKARA